MNGHLIWKWCTLIIFLPLELVDLVVAMVRGSLSWTEVAAQWWADWIFEASQGAGGLGAGGLVCGGVRDAGGGHSTYSRNLDCWKTSNWLPDRRQRNSLCWAGVLKSTRHAKRTNRERGTDNHHHHTTTHHPPQ